MLNTLPSVDKNLTYSTCRNKHNFFKEQHQKTKQIQKSYLESNIKA